jgi:hypothetical protein
MIENSVRYLLYCRIAIDPIFPPPKFNFNIVTKNSNMPDNFLESNQYELIFDNGYPEE